MKKKPEESAPVDPTLCESGLSAPSPTNDDRTERLHAFPSDPRWVKAKEDTEQDGPLIQFAETELWTPTRFSALQ